MSSPNQRIIKIVKDETRYKGYLQVSNVNLNEALYNLKPSAFKLWIYLCDNKNGYDLVLYPVDFCRIANVSDTTYRSAFKELEEKGYLIKDDESKTKYWFMEKSEEARKPDSDMIEKVDNNKSNREALERALERRKQEKQQS